MIDSEYQQWTQMMLYCMEQRARKIPAPKRESFLELAKSLLASEKSKKEIKNALAEKFLECML